MNTKNFDWHWKEFSHPTTMKDVANGYISFDNMDMLHI
jgi:hypothetical protein